MNSAWNKAPDDTELCTSYDTPRGRFIYSGEEVERDLIYLTPIDIHSVAVDRIVITGECYREPDPPRCPRSYEFSFER